MGKRQDEARKTRQKLIDAINVLAKEKEYNDIRIEEITEKAGVAKGTFYVYFKRKEDLISAASYGGFESIKEEALEEADVIAQIHHYLQASTALIVAEPLETAQQWLRSAVSPLEGASSGADKLCYDTKFIEECLRSGMESKQLKKDLPVSALALRLIAQYYGTLTVWCISGGELSMQALMDDFCNSTLTKCIEDYKI